MRRHREIASTPLPAKLAEALASVGVTSNHALAQIALALKRDAPHACEIEHCPHCGGELRRCP
jgi:hypothetical protein